MLVISEDQMAAMTREHVFTRLHAFLVEHSSDPALQALLASATMCHAFWEPHYRRFAHLCEYDLVLRLSYLLAARAHGFDPRIADLDSDTGEIAMKSRMEERGVLPFGVFDDV